MKAKAAKTAGAAVCRAAKFRAQITSIIVSDDWAGGGDSGMRRKTGGNGQKGVLKKGFRSARGPARMTLFRGSDQHGTEPSVACAGQAWASGKAEGPQAGEFARPKFLERIGPKLRLTALLRWGLISFSY